VTAWVLVWALGFNSGFTISGIASEAACHELAAKLGFTQGNKITHDYKCVSYQAIK
jgi:hypothetical protein